MNNNEADDLALTLFKKDSDYWKFADIGRLRPTGETLVVFVGVAVEWKLAADMLPRRGRKPLL